MHAARIGVSLKDCIAYVTWPPCNRCSRSLIQAGIKKIVIPSDIDIPDRWNDEFNLSKSMLNEAGVELKII